MVTQTSKIAQSMYEVQFERIGRNHNPPRLIVAAADAEDLAELVYRHARPYLNSRDVEVVVDLDAGTGHIFCGVQSGGTFTVTAVAGDPS